MPVFNHNITTQLNHPYCLDLMEFLPEAKSRSQLSLRSTRNFKTLEVIRGAEPLKIKIRISPVKKRRRMIRRQIMHEITKEANETCDSYEPMPLLMKMGEKQYGFVTPTRDDQDMPEFPNFSDLPESSSAQQNEIKTIVANTCKKETGYGSKLNNRKKVYDDKNLEQSEDEMENEEMYINNEYPETQFDALFNFDGLSGGLDQWTDSLCEYIPSGSYCMFIMSRFFNNRNFDANNFYDDSSSP